MLLKDKNPFPLCVGGSALIVVKSNPKTNPKTPNSFLGEENWERTAARFGGGQRKLSRRGCVEWLGGCVLHNQLEGCARAGLVPRFDDLRADPTRVL